MRCVIPNCVQELNDTPNGITYHEFPTEAMLQAAWLAALRQTSCLVTDIGPNEVVCSRHFPASAWVEGVGGQLELSSSAVPIVTTKLPNDMDNYMEYHLMGSVSQVRMKQGCMPTKFQCQSDRRKRISDATEGPYILEKQGKTLTEEYQKDLEELSTKQEELSRKDSTEEAQCDVKVCRVCFTSDSRLYFMTEYKTLYKAYETLTGLLLEHEEHLPRYLCSECAGLLLRCERFRTRCLRAHLLLLDVARTNDRITLQLIQSVNDPRSQVDENECSSAFEHDDMEFNINTTHSIKENSSDSRENVSVKQENVNLNKWKSMIDENNTNNGKDALNNDIKVENEIGNNQNILDGQDKANDDTVCIRNIPKDNILVDIKAENDDVETENTANSMVFMSSLPEDILGSVKAENDYWNNQKSHSIRNSTIEDEKIEKNIEQKGVEDGDVAKAISKYNICNLTADTKHTLSRDIEGETPQTSARSNVSNKTSSNKASEVKSRAHGSMQYACEICNKQFNSEKNLKTHLLTHSGQKPFSCDLCNKTYLTKSSLNTHMRTIHSGQTYLCNECGKEFNRIDNYRTHMTTHSGLKPFSCDSCDKTFATRSTLKIHLKKHSGNRLKPYTCDICNNSFYSSDDLKQHLVVHSGSKPFACECGVAFSKSNNLKAHMRIHSGERPYTCDACAKTFNRKDDLKKHLGTHFGPKQYSCDVCRKAFARKDCLVLHLRAHGGVLPHACALCDRAFVRKCNLKIHMRVHSRGKK